MNTLLIILLFVILICLTNTVKESYSSDGPSSSKFKFEGSNAKHYAQCSNGVQYLDGVCTGWSQCGGNGGRTLQGYANDGKTKKDWGWSAHEIDRLTHSACLGSTEMGLNRPLPDGYSYDATGTCAVIPPRGRGTGKQTLSCPKGGTIDKVLFASYGLPRGSCKSGSGGDFKIDPKCHDPNSQKIVEGQCLGKNSCTIDANTAYTDTCDKKDGSIFDRRFPRRLAVVVNCKNPLPPSAPPPLTVTLTTEEKKQANTHYICPEDCMYATCGHNLDRFPGDLGAINVGSANGSACKVGYKIWCDNRHCAPTTFHPPAPPPHAPWNIDSHISHIQNPIMGHGEFNNPLPSVNATFIKRKNPNIPLNSAPAPNQ